MPLPNPKKVKPVGMRPKVTQEHRVCRNCSLHYDEHDKGYDGRMILCRCPHFKFSRLLDYTPDTCIHFDKITV